MAKVIVVYGGGFQPFHVGHLSSYLQAKKAFPNAEFYVTASDNTNTRPIPFQEKQWLGVQAGVLPQDFRNVAVKSPLNPVEILSQYNPNEDIFILVRSERDPVPYKRKDGSPSYYQPFKGLDKCVPFNSQGGHGYVFVTKKEDFSINGNQVYSGTQVRELYQQANDTGRNRIVKDMYPKSPNQSKIRQILDMYIGSPAEPKQAKVAKPKVSAVKKLQANPLQERILKVIQTARPMLREATVEQKVKLLKIMKEAIAEGTVDMPFGSISGQDVDIGLQHRNEQVAYSGLKRLGLVDNGEQFLTLQEIAKMLVDSSNFHIFALDTNPVRAYVKFIKMIGWNKDNPTQYNKQGITEVTKQDAIKQYKDIQDYKYTEKPKDTEKDFEEFLKISLNRPQKNQDVEEDWNKVNHHDKTDGMSTKAVKAYRRENPGSKLKTAVTTKPSKLKAGSKDAKRRKSFCARMSGNKGPMKTPTGKPTPKALALRRWNCESVEELEELVMIAEQKIAEAKNWKQQAAIAIAKKNKKKSAIAEGIETINGSKYNVDPNKYYVWAWDGAAVLYGEYDNVEDAKLNLPKIEQRAIERLGPYAKDAFELSTGKDLLQRYGKKEVNEISDETLQNYLGKADRQINNRLDRMSQARERLNKNYEIYDVNNPTKIIDKFEANTPELAREYFNKFIKEYNPGDQDFHFEVRRSTGLSEEGVAEGSLNETSSDEAWELVGQPVPEIQQFVKQMGYGNDEQSVAKITSIIDRVPATQIPAASIPKLKNLANKGNDAQTLKSILQISGRPDAEQQYTKLMQARDAGEGRNRDVSGYIQYVKSGNYDPPVLLKLPTGVYVIGGRTRLYAALALGVPANVKIISANNFKQGVAEDYLPEK